MGQKRITWVFSSFIFISFFLFFGCAPRESKQPESPSGTSIRNDDHVRRVSLDQIDEPANARRVTMLACEPIDPGNLPEAFCAGTDRAQPMLRDGACVCQNPDFIALPNKTDGHTCLHKEFVQGYASVMIKKIRETQVRPIEDTSNFYPSCFGKESCNLFLAQILDGEKAYQYVVRGLLLANLIRFVMRLEQNNDQGRMDELFEKIEEERELAEIEMTPSDNVRGQCITLETAEVAE